MGRVIRVSSCADCPHTIFGNVDDGSENEYLGCKFMLQEDDTFKCVVEHIFTKTLPDNCPLEDLEILLKDYSEEEDFNKHVEMGLNEP